MFKGLKNITTMVLLLTLILSLTITNVYANTIETTEIGGFIDDLILLKLQEYNIPNATVSVVKDGEIVFKKGYGFQDIEKSIPVDADNTIFRIGSTSKLFTWTAVMQLVEAGMLDLDEDVNTYLDFEIPSSLIKNVKDPNPKAITLNHLMTHTAGFEDYVNMIFRLNADELMPLEEYVKNHLPVRIFPAGEVMAYSNYGTALAGYIVERVSGLPFDEYVEKNIFNTLGMKNTTFRQTLPEEIANNMSKAYRYIDGSFKEGGFEYLIPAAAGSGSSTALDMAMFMIAHLEGGSYNGAEILSNPTLSLMHQQSFTHHPILGGMAHGFMEGSYNNQRVLFHGGDTMLYSTGLYLIPDENLGLFISYSGGGHQVHSEVFQEFMDYYFPAASPTIKAAPEGSIERAKRFNGEYHLNRKSLTTSEKITSLVMAPIHIKSNKDGYLLVSYLGETSEFVEIEPGIYQNQREGRSQDYNGPFNHIVFKTDPYGRTMITTDGPMTYSKAPFYATMAFTISSIIISLLIFLSSLLFWIIKGILILIKRKGRPSRLATLAVLIGIAFSITVLLIFAGILSEGNVDPIYQLPTEAYIPVEGSSQGIAILLYGLTIGLLIFTVIAWWKRLWKPLGRIHYSLYTATALGIMLIFNYWNMFK